MATTRLKTRGPRSTKCSLVWTFKLNNVGWSDRILWDAESVGCGHWSGMIAVSLNNVENPDVRSDPIEIFGTCSQTSDNDHFNFVTCQNDFFLHRKPTGIQNPIKSDRIVSSLVHVWPSFWYVDPKTRQQTSWASAWAEAGKSLLPGDRYIVPYTACDFP